MKTSVLRIIGAYALCVSSLFAAEPRSRQMLREAMMNYRFATVYQDRGGRTFVREYIKAVPEPVEWKPSHWTMRSLEAHIASRTQPRDRLTLGLEAIVDNIGADDIASSGVSWRDEDRVFGFRSLKKFSYQYKPTTFPHRLSALLDDVFGEPVRVFLTNRLSF